MIETGKQLAAREDADVAQAIGALFKQDGIELVLAARIARVFGQSGTDVAVHLEDGRRFSGSHILAHPTMAEVLGMLFAKLQPAKLSAVAETVQPRALAA